MTPNEPLDPRPARAATDPRRFGTLLLQLVLLLVVFRLFSVEESAFFGLAVTAFAGFAVHYWLPFRWKEPFWIALSAGGAFVLLDWRSATALLACVGALYAIVALPLRFPVRLVIVLAGFGALMWLRGSPPLWLPSHSLAVIGAALMFRLLVYLYDLGQMKGRPPLKDFLAYFLMLPNHYFLLFPVVDYHTLRKSWYRRDIHAVAQQGIDWIVRGTIQLLLYRIIYFSKYSGVPDEITSIPRLIVWMVSVYLLYLRVSGQFHVIIGLLHLFGYDLPETHRRYLLASSLTDFWRRINIYWKDFMVKLVYFPTYFRLRRRGEIQAQIAGTACVFAATWFLHSYQYFWLTGRFLFTAPDILFWAVLGALVAVNVVLEIRRPKRRVAPAAGPGLVLRGLKIAATFAFITTIWSIWNSPSITEWWELVRTAVR